RHLRDRLVGAEPEEQALGVRRPALLGPHRPRGVDQRAVRERAQEPDGVEEVGLADAVDAGDAREGAEVDVQVEEVLEPRDLEAGAPPGAPPPVAPTRRGPPPASPSPPRRPRRRARPGGPPRSPARAARPAWPGGAGSPHPAPATGPRRGRT